MKKTIKCVVVVVVVVVVGVVVGLIVPILKVPICTSLHDMVHDPYGTDSTTSMLAWQVEARLPDSSVAREMAVDHRDLLPTAYSYANGCNAVHGASAQIGRGSGGGRRGRRGHAPRSALSRWR